MVSRRTMTLLVIAALLLPIAICLVLGTARLLSALGDASGGLFLDRAALLLGGTWVFCLICLVIAQSLATLQGDDNRPEESLDEEQ